MKRLTGNEWTRIGGLYLGDNDEPMLYGRLNSMPEDRTAYIAYLAYDGITVTTLSLPAGASLVQESDDIINAVNNVEYNPEDVQVILPVLLQGDEEEPRFVLIDSMDFAETLYGEIDLDVSTEVIDLSCDDYAELSAIFLGTAL